MDSLLGSGHRPAPQEVHRQEAQPHLLQRGTAPHGGRAAHHTLQGFRMLLSHSLGSISVPIELQQCVLTPTCSLTTCVLDTCVCYEGQINPILNEKQNLSLIQTSNSRSVHTQSTHGYTPLEPTPAPHTPRPR